jgi:cytochrome c biogenesis protein CcdA
MHIIPIKLTQSWPLSSVFTGLALIPAGWHHYGTLRKKYIVPSIAFILLGCALMVFSLHLVAFSLKQFVVDWWPLLTVLAGLTLILVSLSTKYSGKGQ